MEGKWKRFKRYFSLCLQAVGENRKEKGVVLFLTTVDSEALDNFNSFQLTWQKKLYWNCITEIWRELRST